MTQMKTDGMINLQHQTSPKIERHQRTQDGLNPGAALQAYLLDGVSRTFALTIPQLPAGLHSVVSNNYLLCRIIDTIEDEPALTWPQKQYFSELFIDVVSSNEDASEFSRQLAPMLSDSTIPAEHELIQYTPQVINITTGFNLHQRKALEHCVKVMGEGMVTFQANHNSQGLADLSELDRYCYHVAGIVGETLTKLFCNYSEEIAKNEIQMMNLAASFGQGLQMTNILKDIWDDQERGACWLPRDIFKETGFELEQLIPGHYQEDFGKGLVNLIGIARRHLNNAIDYTLLVPSHETGIRNFCLWAIGLAILTLRKIYKHRNFSSGQEVKITRRSVKATVFTSRLAASHDLLVRSIFNISSLGLPAARNHFAN